MENFYKLSTSRKKEIFNQAGNQTGLPESAIEKDWWVTLVLKAIFELSYAQHIVFKGGCMKGITDIDLLANESISHDTDPLVLELRYNSVTDVIKYIQPSVTSQLI